LAALAVHVIIAAHHNRRLQVPSIDVDAQPLATLAKACFGSG